MNPNQSAKSLVENHNLWFPWLFTSFVWDDVNSGIINALRGQQKW